MTNDKLTEAEAAAWPAQQALDRLARSMAAIGAPREPRLSPIETLGSADSFLAYLLSRAASLSRVSRTCDQMAEVVRWLEATIDWLGDRLEDLARQSEILRTERGSYSASPEPQQECLPTKPPHPRRVHHVAPRASRPPRRPGCGRPGHFHQPAGSRLSEPLQCLDRHGRQHRDVALLQHDPQLESLVAGAP